MINEKEGKGKRARERRRNTVVNSSAYTVDMKAKVSLLSQHDCFYC